MHIYVRPHTLSLPYLRPPRLVSHMRVRTHTRTATSPSAPSNGPAHCLTYFAFVLPVLPCTPAHSPRPARSSPQPHPPVHALATHAHPVRPRLAPTLAMPSPSTNTCKRP